MVKSGKNWGMNEGPNHTHQELQYLRNEVKKLNNQFDLLFDNSPYMMYEIDIKGPKLLRVNDVLCEKMGYTREEFLSRDPMNFIDRESKKLFQDTIENFPSVNKQPYWMEYTGVSKDGDQVIGERNIIFTYENGMPKGAFVIVHDVTQRKKNEESLKESEELYRSLFEVSDDGFELLEVLFDEDSIAYDCKILMVNQAFEHQTGLKKKDVLGQRTNKIIPLLEDSWLEIIGRVVRTGKPEHMVEFNKHTNRWYDDYIFKFKHNQVGLLIRDITERKNDEKALKESEELYRTLFENNQDGFVLVEPVFDDEGNSHDFVMLDFNKVWEDQTGLNAADYLGKTITEAMPDVEPIWISNFAEVCKTDEPIHFESYNKVADKWFDIYAFTFKKGQVGVLFNDISKRKRAEEALEDVKNNLELQVKERTLQLSNERQRLYNIFEKMPVMVWLITSDYRIPFANKAFRDKFGEAEGRYCYDYCFGLSEPCDFCESFNVFETGKPHNWECKTKDGSVLHVYDFPFTDIDGTKLILEIDIDVTNYKQAQDALSNYNVILEKKVAERTRKLEKSNKELEQFAYVASHDLQEPLRMVSSFTQLLERKYKGKLDSNADDYIGFILDGSKRMKDLIDDLLTLSRLDTENNELELNDLNQVLDDVLLDLKSTMDETNAQVTCDHLPVAYCDSSQIRQVFQNLIRNAIKFHQKIPRIHISAGGNENEWIIGVKDNGIGIDPKHHQEIFEVFRRLHTREEYAGTGIGLAICKRLIDGHNGRIWVESEPEKGATFYFTIPK
ncbi:MAG TPA: PAS domain S-box protein [Methanobacterium sp.]|jgi:PAS domain S-box-containing protein|nr:MAG: PAS domain S-box protein [Methanobacterium sp.]HOI71023.1 PAS domain S-box protein [Methanobacterium sp.]